MAEEDGLKEDPHEGSGQTDGHDRRSQNRPVLLGVEVVVEACEEEGQRAEGEIKGVRCRLGDDEPGRRGGVYPTEHQPGDHEFEHGAPPRLRIGLAWVAFPSIAAIRRPELYALSLNRAWTIDFQEVCSPSLEHSKRSATSCGRMHEPFEGHDLSAITPIRKQRQIFGKQSIRHTTSFRHGRSWTTLACPVIWDA
jgi:hypothetical protein